MTTMRLLKLSSSFPRCGRLDVAVIFLVLVGIILCGNNSNSRNRILPAGVTALSSSSSKQVGRISAGPPELHLDVSRIGCGTWSWGNRLLFDYKTAQDQELYDSYQYIRQHGITLFDTADSYGTADLNGRSEILLGQFERHYQQGFKRVEQEETNNKPFWETFLNTNNKNKKNSNQQQIATKFAPYPWRITRQSMVQAAEASLGRIYPEYEEEEKDTNGTIRIKKSKQLAIAQLHWSTSQYQPFQEKAIVDGIADVYDRGYCAGVGVSNYGPQQFLKVAARMAARQVPLVTAQTQFSLMTYADTSVTEDMLQVCRDTDQTRVIAYSPLCLGLLTGKYNLDRLPTSGKSPLNFNPRRQLFRELLPGATPLLQTLDVMGKETNTSSAQIAIAWCLAKNTVPIPGIRTVSQAQQTIEAATELHLSPDMVTELDVAAKAVTKPMIQNIFQTK